MMIKFMRKYKILITPILIISLGSVYLFFNKKADKEPQFITVARTSLLQEVSVTGRIKPATSIDLAFEKGGKIAKSYTNVGNKVAQGALLAYLENEDISAELTQAEATLESAEIKISELKRGARPEEIAISRAKVSSAEASFIDAKNNLVDKLKDAYTKSDDAVRNKTNQFFDNLLSQDPRLNSSINANTDIERKTELLRFSVEKTLEVWNLLKTSLSIFSDLDIYIINTKQDLNEVAIFLDSAAAVINSVSANNNLTQATLDVWRADVATGRANVNSAISNLSSAEEKLKTSESNLLIAKKELELKESGATKDEIASEEAKIKSLKASVNQKRAQLAKTFIRSPISGVITKINAYVGEIVSANTVLISIISSARLEIEANVPEADVAKIKIGSISEVVLDAYGNDFKFDATVSAIDPAATMIEGVATYKTNFALLQDDSRIKPGMTADITILTDKREHVIAIPARAVLNKDSGKFVKILAQNEQIEKEVRTGLRGSNGNIEILSGLSEGDKVIISP